MATTTKPEKRTTADVMQLLRTRFEMPEYALLENVANGVGLKANGRRRFADALAIEQFGRAGHHLHGFEVKVSRADWLRELKDDSKADSVFRYCDFWWVVVGDPAIVKDDELPDGWGLLYARGNALVAKAEPRRQRDVVVHDRAFVAAIFRRAREQQLDKKILNAEVSKAVNAEREFQQRLAENARKNLQDRYDALAKGIAEFEAATGLKISDTWRYSYQSPGDLGRAVQLVLSGEAQIRHVAADLQRLRQQTGFIIHRIDDALGKQPKEEADGAHGEGSDADRSGDGKTAEASRGV